MYTVLIFGLGHYNLKTRSRPIFASITNRNEVKANLGHYNLKSRSRSPREEQVKNLGHYNYKTQIITIPVISTIKPRASLTLSTTTSKPKPVLRVLIMANPVKLYIMYCY